MTSVYAWYDFGVVERVCGGMGISDDCPVRGHHPVGQVTAARATAGNSVMTVMASDLSCGLLAPDRPVHT
jgi:hypothetical protein